MATFTGDYTCKVDGKNRITLPSSFKKQLPASSQDKFVVRKDMFEKCLVLYTLDEWDVMSKEIKGRLNPYNRDHNKILRGFFKDTQELEVDASNRILIPRRILDQAEIDKEVILAGQGSKIEIWAKELYDEVDNGEGLALLAEKYLGGTSKQNE